MIQTKQTVLLWLAALLPISLFRVAIASTAEPTTEGIFADSAYTLGEGTPGLIIYLVALIFTVAVTFMYKNRNTQVKLAQVALILFAIGLPAGIYLSVGTWTGVSLAIPAAIINLLSVVLIILSIRFIQNDIKIVKSMDRLR